jgi:hypothetical protein
MVARSERYGPGEDAREFVPGDFILSHRHHLIAGLISQAPKRRFRGADAVYARKADATREAASDSARVRRMITP